MHDNSNEFEKQVQKKLQGLNFTPSAPVWERVAAQLPASRRRRGYMVWAPLLAAAAVGGFLFFYPTTDADTTKSTLAASHTERHAPEMNQPDDGNARLRGIPGNSTGGNSTGRNLTGGNLTGENSGVDNLRVENSTSGRSTGGKSTGGKSTAGTLEAGPAPDPAGMEGPAGHGKTNLAQHAPGVPPSGSRLEKPAGIVPGTVIPVMKSRMENDSAGKTVLPDFIAGAGQARFPARTLAPVAVSGTHRYGKSLVLPPGQKPIAIPDAGTIAPRADIAVASRKKWNLEPGFNAGQSIFNNGSVNKMFRAVDPTVLNSPASGRPNSPAPPTLQSPGMTLAAATRKPSEIKPGKSIAVGMDLRHTLTRRLSVSTGLYYNLLTTNMKIGNKVAQEMYVQQDGREKVLSEYYNTGSDGDYTNSYHFIELPVLLNVQLNRGKKIPLYMSGGVSFARLVSTDALHYDGIQNIYYADKSLVKKNYVNVQGGFSARVPAGKNLALLVGPEIQYGLTNMLQGEDGNSDKHSLFIGVKVGLSF